MEKRLLAAFLSACLPLLPAPASAGNWAGARLWQEGFFWDALLLARDKAARQQADPQLLAVVRAIAQQVAQQAVNLQQIHAYAKGQQNNIRFAFSQEDPAKSLGIIRNNFETLTKGTVQIRNNLYYLTARCRMGSSQALPDPELTSAAALLIAQIQAVQLQLNALYADTAAVQAQANADADAADGFFRFSADSLLRSVVEVQDSVFSVYNAAYELHVRSR